MPQRVGPEFKQRDQVAWLSPLTWWAVARAKMTRGEVVGRPVTPDEIAVDANFLDCDELYFDFIADTGDGYDAARTVAELLASRDLSMDGSDGDALPRAKLVLHGGDMVYPAGTDQAYHDRFVGPISAAWTGESESDGEALFAIPGNHDLYDSGNAWRKLVVDSDTTGPWSTPQKESWFAIQLSPKWLVLGFDIDSPSERFDSQYQYFETILAQHPQSSVIVVISEPWWSKPGPSDVAEAHHKVRRIIETADCELAMWLTGDLHHYSRYVGDDGVQYITAGGGGAFLTLTHTLPDTIEVNETDDLELAAVYPPRETSKRLRWRALGLVGNLFFGPVMGAIYLILGVMAQWLDVSALVIWPFAMMAGTAFTRELKLRSAVIGSLHGLAHLAMVEAFLAVGPTWIRPLLLFVFGATAGSFLVGGALIASDKFGISNNELSAAIHHDGHGCFIRFHLASDGTITGYPVGIETQRRANATQQAPRELIEKPFLIE